MQFSGDFNSDHSCEIFINRNITTKLSTKYEDNFHNNLILRKEPKLCLVKDVTSLHDLNFLRAVSRYNVHIFLEDRS